MQGWRGVTQKLKFLIWKFYLLDNPLPLLYKVGRSGHFRLLDHTHTHTHTHTHRVKVGNFQILEGWELMNSTLRSVKCCTADVFGIWLILHLRVWYLFNCQHQNDTYIESRALKNTYANSWTQLPDYYANFMPLRASVLQDRYYLFSCQHPNGTYADSRAKVLHKTEPFWGFWYGNIRFSWTCFTTSLPWYFERDKLKFSAAHGYRWVLPHWFETWIGQILRFLFPWKGRGLTSSCSSDIQPDCNLAWFAVSHCVFARLMAWRRDGVLPHWFLVLCKDVVSVGHHANCNDCDVLLVTYMYGIVDGRGSGHLGPAVGLKTLSIHVCICPHFGM